MDYALIGAMLMVGLLPMAVEAARGRFDPFNLKNAFIAYFLLQLAISGLPTLLTEEATITGPNVLQHLEYYEIALLLSVVGLAFFHFGYYVALGAHLRLPILFRATWRPGRLPLIAGAYLLMGAVGLYLFLSGYDSLTAARDAWRAGDIKGQGFITFCGAGLPAIAVLLWMTHRGSQLKFGWKFLLIVSAALTPAFAMGFRSLLLFPILQFIVVWHYTVRPIRARKLVPLLVACGIVFTGYGIWRTVPAGLDINTEAVAEVLEQEPELLYSLVVRSRGIEVVASVIKKLDESPDYQLFIPAIYEAATIAIPGSLWEKPTPSGERFSTYFFGADLAFTRDDYTRDLWGGVSPTVIGELYWQGWWLGVIFGMFFLGVLVRLAYNTMRANQGRPAVLLVYAIAFTHVLGMAEAPQGYINGLVLYAIAVTLTLLVLTMRMSAHPITMKVNP